METTFLHDMPRWYLVLHAMWRQHVKSGSPDTGRRTTVGWLLAIEARKPEETEVKFMQQQ